MKLRWQREKDGDVTNPDLDLLRQVHPRGYWAFMGFVRKQDQGYVACALGKHASRETFRTQREAKAWLTAVITLEET